MAIIETETYRTIPRSRTPLLLGVRDYKCSYVSPQDEEGLDTHGARVGDGGGSVFPPPRQDRVSGTRSEFRDDNEPDPFADWQGVEPMKFPEGCDHPEARMWYSRGRTDKLLESIAAQDEMIKKVIEIANR